MQFLKNNWALCGLVAYFLWWLFFLVYFNSDYRDSGGDGVIMSVGMITIVIIVAFLVLLMVAAINTKNWKKYLAFIVLVLIPPLMAVAHFVFD